MRAFITIIAVAVSVYGERLLTDTFEKSIDDAVLSGAEIIDDDDGGKCVRAVGAVMYPQSKYIDPREGTVDFRLRFNAESALTNNATLTLFRAVAPGGKDSFANTIVFMRGWGTGALLLVGDKDGKRTTINFPKIREWKIGEWHRIAFTWKTGEAGASEVALYADGALVEKKSALTIIMDDALWAKAMETPKSRSFNDYQYSCVWFGGCWGTKDADVFLDDLSIFKIARQYRRQ
ncbi:MAG: hypothetical protein AABZ39_07240 [Spirochaetota bacterium]